MGARSRPSVLNPLVPAAPGDGPVGKDRICATPRPARALPPPLPQAAAPCLRPVAAPSEGTRKPLIAWTPVAGAILLCAVLIGGLALLIRRVPADAEPTEGPAVALAADEPREPARADPPLPAPAAKVEPVPPARKVRPARRAVPIQVEPVPTRPADAAPAAPAAAPAEDPAPPVQDEPGAAPAQVDHRYGTSIDFVDSPTEAAEKALKEKKLLFVLQVAGNFEKDCFT